MCPGTDRTRRAASPRCTSVTSVRTCPVSGNHTLVPARLDRDDHRERRCHRRDRRRPLCPGKSEGCITSPLGAAVLHGPRGQPDDQHEHDQPRAMDAVRAPRAGFEPAPASGGLGSRPAQQAREQPKPCPRVSRWANHGNVLGTIFQQWHPRASSPSGRRHAWKLHRAAVTRVCSGETWWCDSALAGSAGMSPPFPLRPRPYPPDLAWIWHGLHSAPVPATHPGDARRVAHGVDQTAGTGGTEAASRYYGYQAQRSGSRRRSSSRRAAFSSAQARSVASSAAAARSPASAGAVSASRSPRSRSSLASSFAADESPVSARAASAAPGSSGSPERGCSS